MGHSAVPRVREIYAASHVPAVFAISIILHNIHYAQKRTGQMRNRDPDQTVLELALLLLALAVAVQVAVVRGMSLPRDSASYDMRAF
jgi:hypothetical protein